MLGKVCGRAPRLRLKAKLRRLLALLLGLCSLKRGRRSDCGVVARETRPSIPRHRRRSLRSRTWPVQPRWPLSDSRWREGGQERSSGPLSPRGTDPYADPYRGASTCRIVPVGARFPNTNRLSRIGEARVQFPGPGRRDLLCGVWASITSLAASGTGPPVLFATVYASGSEKACQVSR
jgi:hypothetical protein